MGCDDAARSRGTSLAVGSTHLSVDAVAFFSFHLCLDNFLYLSPFPVGVWVVLAVANIERRNISTACGRGLSMGVACGCTRSSLSSGMGTFFDSWATIGSKM